VPGGLVYMRNGRDIGSWVHVDVLFQAYFQAFLVMASLGVPANPGNPYNSSATQIGFGTFGGPHFAALLCEVATRALKAVWFQKWFLHRRMRPEVFLGRVHYQLTGVKNYGVHQDILDSAAVDESFSRNGTYFLPMAFPEGSPAHPAYGAGHATVAGACVTMLKALFDAEHLVTDFFPVVEPTDDGSGLVPYGGGDIGMMTLTGELNKLASNVATGRNIAGVHWRTDGEESIELGEAIAISVLRDQRLTYNETFAGFTFKKFDGSTITI
jgi:membrane-associated phospholipid phosphatase